MNKIKAFFLAFAIAVSCFYLQAQENVDCFHPTKITIPFVSLQKDGNLEKINYQTDDKYTFWYKITATKSTILKYQLMLINGNDSYTIMIYKFNGNNFCNDVIKHKTKPFSLKSNGEINIKKGEVYYFSIIHLSGQGCGHFFKITANNKTRVYKAIQNECMEEAINLLTTKKDTLVTPSKRKTNKFYGFVINTKTKSIIDANIWIARKKHAKKIVSTLKGFTLNSDSAKKLTIAIKKLGYQKLDTTIELIKDTFKLFLKPINIGQKVVMRSIYFHPNTYVLKEESKPALKSLLQFMLENPGYNFEIQGHTNGNRNIKANKKYKNLSEAWNFKGSAKKLSKLRAETIKNYLIKNGVKLEKLKTIGFGGDKMLIKKPKNMQEAIKNIRVEVVVLQ